MKKIGVIGCGAWATTVAMLLAKNNHAVMMWCHKQDYAHAIHMGHENPFVLPGVTLPLTLQARTDMSMAVSGCEALVLGIASPYLTQVLEQLKPIYTPGTPILSLTKGLLDNDTLFPSDYLNLSLSKCPIAVLSGPNLALEIAQGKPAASVISSEKGDIAQLFQQYLNSSSFRVYTSADTRGVELGGILKNIMAIAAGLIDGLDLGYNAKAALITRALPEMSRFGSRFNAHSETFYGLSGLGDLIATCTSSHSRNWKVGHALAKGETLDTLASGSAISEGVRTIKVVYKIAQTLRIDMPITFQLYRVIYENLSPLEALQTLMSRDAKSEHLNL